MSNGYYEKKKKKEGLSGCNCIIVPKKDKMRLDRVS